MFVQVKDGEIVATRLPSKGFLADGTPVSGYDKLMEEDPELAHAEGWREVEDDGPPEHDPKTHYTDRTLEIEDDSVVAIYVVREREFIEPETTADDDLRAAIESASNLNELKAALLGTSPNARAQVAGRPT